jgi:hypothetical protein
MKKNTNKKEGPKIDIIALDFFFLKKKITKEGKSWTFVW